MINSDYKSKIEDVASDGLRKYIRDGDMHSLSELDEKIVDGLMAEKLNSLTTGDFFDVMASTALIKEFKIVASDLFKSISLAKNKNECEWHMFKAGRKIIPAVIKALRESYLNGDIALDYHYSLSDKILDWNLSNGIESYADEVRYGAL